MPPPLHKPLFTDGRKEPFDRSMVEVLRRLDRFQTKVNLDAMALIGPDAIALDGVAILRIGPNDLHQVLATQGPSMAFHRDQQVVDIDPAVRIEPDPDHLGLVPENEAEEFAHSRMVIGTHRSTSLFVTVHGHGKVSARAREVALEI